MRLLHRALKLAGIRAVEIIRHKSFKMLGITGVIFLPSRSQRDFNSVRTTFIRSLGGDAIAKGLAPLCGFALDGVRKCG